jgi:hypothetical protein
MVPIVTISQRENGLRTYKKKRTQILSSSCLSFFTKPKSVYLIFLRSLIQTNPQHPQDHQDRACHLPKAETFAQKKIA